MKLCFASNNPHKLEEVRHGLSNFELMSLDDIGCKEELPETRDTLEGNAKQKASYVLDRYGVPCFADDTGLEVDALGGAPGVYSARFAGPHRNSLDNIELLLKKMQGVENRGARFRTVMAVVFPQGEWLFEGIVMGTILETPRGSGGFGYDPIFLPAGFSKTLAEMTLSEKNRISHRALALQKVVGFLNRFEQRT